MATPEGLLFTADQRSARVKDRRRLFDINRQVSLPVQNACIQAREPACFHARAGAGR
jgi:hypothetical protein